MKSKIYIRVDGNTEIGLGHLVRCTALAHMLKDTFYITFVCKVIPDELAKELITHNFQLQIIEQDSNFLNLLEPGIIVVLDGYHFETVFQKQIKALGCKLVCIDDLHNRPFYADLIINHAPGVTREDYIAQSYTKFNLGPEYALLRPAFLEQAKIERKIGKIQTVFVCFGGSDSKNLTLKTLKVLITLDKFERIIVVTGQAYNSLDQLCKFNSSRNNIIDHYQGVNDDQMLELMLQSELVIVPSSGILFEALTTGSIIISGFYTNNQMNIYNGFKSLNAFLDVFDFNNQSIKKGILASLATDHHFRKIIDGKSGGRFINQFKSLNN